MPVLIYSIQQGRNTYVEFEFKAWEIQELLLCLLGTTWIYMLSTNELFTSFYWFNIKNSNEPGNKSIQKFIILLMNKYVIAKIFADHKVVWKIINIFPRGLFLNVKKVCFGDRDKLVHPEISRGGYVTAYDGLALPNFMVHLPSQNYFIIDIDVEEELNERVNGGYLYDVGEKAKYLNNTMREVKLERSRVLLGADRI